jgi:hypothetical protein
MNAFQEPSDDWLPIGDFTDGQPVKTAGTRTAKPRERPTAQNTKRDLLPSGADSSLGSVGVGGGVGVGVGVGGESSVLADRSLTVDDRRTINTTNLEMIAEQLVKSDELIRIIAKRLGLPEERVVPADDLSSVFSVDSASTNDDNSKFGVPIAGDLEVNKARKLNLSPGEAMPAPRDAWDRYLF